MELNVKNREDAGSCQFCDKGKVTEFGKMIFPYQKVAVITGGRNHKSIICKECLDELNSITKLTEKTTVWNREE
jgi:hypothetical protein